MVAEVAGREDVTLDLILERGRTRGFTLQGEMFSATSLASLAREVLEVEVRLETADRLLDTGWVLEILQSGGLVVLPYDCAPDSSVCLAAGHRAHWGVLTGRPAFNVFAWLRPVKIAKKKN